MILWNILFLAREILAGTFFYIDISLDKTKPVDEASRRTEGKKVHNATPSYTVRRTWRVFFSLFKHIFDWYLVFREHPTY